VRGRDRAPSSVDGERCGRPAPARRRGSRVELREVSFTTDKPNSKSEMAGKTLKTGRGINLKCERCQKRKTTHDAEIPYRTLVQKIRGVYL
jgi:hypothetical protein